MDTTGKLLRLGEDDYKRPKLTYTDKLSVKDIEGKLEDYVKVDTIKDVELGTHLRYITIDKKGKKMFRLGGQLIINKFIPKYVVLGNGNKKWSVQIKNTVFFRKQTLPEIKERYNEKIDKLEEEIDEMKETISILKGMVKKLKKENIELSQNV